MNTISLADPTFFCLKDKFNLLLMLTMAILNLYYNQKPRLEKNLFYEKLKRMVNIYIIQYNYNLRFIHTLMT